MKEPSNAAVAVFSHRFYSFGMAAEQPSWMPDTTLVRFAHCCATVVHYTVLMIWSVSSIAACPIDNTWTVTPTFGECISQRVLQNTSFVEVTWSIFYLSKRPGMAIKFGKSQHVIDPLSTAGKFIRKRIFNGVSY